MDKDNRHMLKTLIARGADLKYENTVSSRFVFLEKRTALRVHVDKSLTLVQYLNDF